MITPEIKVLKSSEQEAFNEQILKMLFISDEEFFPPLSKRSSTTQSELKGDWKSDNGVLSYFEELKKQRFVVATDKDKLLAFVSFRENFTSDIIKENDLPNIYISTLVVSREARGMGITYAMYEKLFDEFKYFNVFTRTWSSNISHIKILSKFNFETFKVIKDDRGKGIDTVYFKKNKN